MEQRLTSSGVTRREAEVLAAVGDRLTNAEIASQLYVSTRTVESHIASLLRKLGAGNRRDLAEIWKRSEQGDRTPADRLPPVFELLADPATYVGRARERDQLRELWQRARQGQLLVAVILGEAGMGKSRIAAELALEVHAGGGAVRLGSCIEGLAIPYQPFVQILDVDATSSNPAELADRLGSSGRVLGRLSPTLAERLAFDGALPGGDKLAERAEILAALREYFDRSARKTPVLVVIEDLHWSTSTTRDALRYLARLGSTAPALFVVTSRDSAPELDEELAACIGDLSRQPCVEVITMSELTEEDIGQLLLDTGRSGRAVEVYAATGGNPLFALEASAGGGPLNSVNALLSTRFDRLTPAERELLDFAVVMGPEFRADLVAAAAARDLQSVLEALESAEAAGLITSQPSEPLRFSFVHALFRTVRYDSLRPSVRLQLHASITSALRPCADDDDVLPLLAHHASASAPLGDVDEAVMLERRAGHLARRRRGYDEAAEHYERALHLLELVGSAEHRLRRLLRVDLATAVLDGGRPAGYELLQEAIEEARQHADDEALANATIALSGVTGTRSLGGDVDREIATMFSEALDRGSTEPSPLRARLLIGLSSRLGSDDVLRARELARSGIDMARAQEDLAALGDGLMTYRWQIWEPALATERLAVGEELLALGRALNDPRLMTGGLSQLLHVQREAGDLVAAERTRVEIEALCARRPHPTTEAIVITYEATKRYLAGDLGGAEAISEKLLDFGPESGVDGLDLYAMSLGAIRGQQGRFEEMIPFIERAVAERPNHRGLAMAALTRGLARAGRLDDAAALMLRFAARDYDIPHDGQWFVGIDALADAVEVLGDSVAATVLRKHLAPFAGRIASSSAGVVRPVDEALAQLAVVLDDLDAATAAATRAVDASRARRTPIFLGRELVLLAAARRRAGVPTHELRPLLDEAQQIAEATGAHLIHQEIERYQLSPAGPPGLDE